MPNLQGASWHKSNLNEYLAQCFLSALGASTPVPRQEDYGIDFHCVLSREDEEQRLTFHSPYNVQCGSESGKEFIYGGFTKGENPRWREEGVRWLYEQEIPFFVCTVDVPTECFRLYSTSPKWLTRHKFGHLKPAAVELMPDQIFNPLDEATVPIKSVGQASEATDGRKYGVPLRGPVVELFGKDLRDNKKLETARVTLKKAIEMEQTNIVQNHHLKVFWVEWLTDIVPNGELKSAQSIHYNPAKGAHIDAQIESLIKPATVLAMNLHAQGDPRADKYLAPLFGFFPKECFSRDLFDKLPPLVLKNWLEGK